MDEEQNPPQRVLIGGAEAMRSFVVYGTWLFPAASVLGMLIVGTVEALMLGGNPVVLLAFFFPLGVMVLLTLGPSLFAGFCAGVLVQAGWAARGRGSGLLRRAAPAVIASVVSSAVIWSVIPVPWSGASWGRWVVASITVVALCTCVAYRAMRNPPRKLA